MRSYNYLQWTGKMEKEKYMFCLIAWDSKPANYCSDLTIKKLEVSIYNLGYIILLKNYITYMYIYLIPDTYLFMSIYITYFLSYLVLILLVSRNNLIISRHEMRKCYNKCNATIKSHCYILNCKMM
ncbi:hypothetical protein HJG60_008640 [Phyllostomus discolor]|uniref:Uncharacterized protein n=1 Tax=Phyllostomus discolor TaxID=89673 RepID=A0A834DI62_9CHIR|nr:hypothetical protein HJG60_008640 [Phyllostomus discolor]